MLLWFTIGLPGTVGALLTLGGRRADRTSGGVGLIVAITTLALAAGSAMSRPEIDVPLFAGIRAGFAVDALSAFMLVTVAAVALAVLVYAVGEPELRTSRFVGLMLLFTAAMLATVTAADLAVLLMAWEVMGATSWALIGYRWWDGGRVQAAHTAFLTTRIGDLGLYLAAGAALAGGIGSLTVAELPAAEPGWRQLIAAGVIAAALGKSAQLPFSFWLSRAMAGPSPVSALLHSATMAAAGGYLLVRTAPLLAAVGWAGSLVAWAGALTAVAMGAVALAQRDLKQLLAASTCSQVGFIVLAAGVDAPAAGAVQLVAHAATKSLLFLGAGAWLLALGTKQLTGLRGAARRFPVVGTTFTVGALSLAGVPPLSLWLTKDSVLAAVREHSPSLYLVGLLAAALSALYSAKAIWHVWQPAEPAAQPQQEEESATDRVSAVAAAPLAVLATAAALGGLLPILLTGGLRVQPMPAPGELLTSGVIALGALALGWYLPRRPSPSREFLSGWLGLERLAHVLVLTPVTRLAGVLARFDDHVLDAGLIALARQTRAVATRLDRRVEWSMDGLVRAVAGAARALGRLARRPQTGQLHQYYAQAAAGLVALAILVIVMR